MQIWIILRSFIHCQAGVDIIKNFVIKNLYISK